MSKIDEIMGAIGRHGDDCIRDSDAASASFEGLREMIAAALADARRDGAEQMREACASVSESIADRQAEMEGFKPPESPSMSDGARECEISIRALPLPTGERQAVMLTDEQVAAMIAQHWGRADIAPQSVCEFARSIEAASLAVNNPEAPRG